MSKEDPVPTAEPTNEYTFHPQFAAKHPGDVILVAGEHPAMAFYFSLPLLSALSNFFATLPAPSTQDILAGTTVIPLPSISVGGLYLLLLAIRAISQGDDLPEGTACSVPNMIDVVTAARLYQVPSVYRVLGDATRGPGADNAYLTYAIWALAGMPFRTAEAAKATLAYPIAFADKYIVDSLKDLVPAEWMRLLEYHTRRVAGIDRFYAGKWLRDSTEYHLAHEYTESSQPHLEREWTACSEPCMELDALIGRMYAKADSMEEIMAVKKRDYGLECSACIVCASIWYDKAVDELVEFARDY